jgi:hypothetical protein
MNTITIEGNTYNIINSTQSDGRCFSASVYYEVYNNTGNGYNYCDSVLSSQQYNMIEQGYNYTDISSFLYPSCS